MQDFGAQFLRDSETKAFDEKHRQTIAFNMRKYAAKVAEGKQQFADLREARRRAEALRTHTIGHLAHYLELWERNFCARGGRVIWAEDAEDARRAVAEIVERHEIKSAVKSKSMLSEEIGLNDWLEKLGINPIETDLGEYIVQLRGEAPYHIVTPAMHLSRKDIAALFAERFGMPADSSAESITAFVRERLRKDFLSADLGITGANFLIAETGSLVVVENEGNARLCTALPRIHVAIAGMERILPRLADLELMLPLLATYGTGQEMTVYNTIYNGARQEGEQDGAQIMYVILLDNGRTRLLADERLRAALHCIRCGSCLNACPVYRSIGGHTYDAPYTGPIGAVLMPHLGAYKDKKKRLADAAKYAHLSEASTLCGACEENCPVNIPLPAMLLYNRQLSAEWGIKKASEARLWRWWRRLMLRRRLLNAPAWLKKLSIRWFLRSLWGSRREFPAPAQKTFAQLWASGEV